MILRARHVLPISAPLIPDGAVVIDESTIVAAGSFSEIRSHYSGDVVDLGDTVLMPGLVNAHCHLDYSMMRRSIQPQRSFTEWIRRINALKRSLFEDDYRAAIRAGFAELRKWGTTTVANIESFPEVLVGMPPPPLRTWWFFEMIDIRHRITTEDSVAGALAFFEDRPGWRGGFGLSPHAPYTASSSLFEQTSKVAEKLNMPVTTHVAESREEWEMFRHGRGELYEFMLKLGRWMHDCHHGRTPLAHLAFNTRLNHRWILAHVNELDPADFNILGSLPRERRPSVAHCPGSHRYFRHGPFPLAKLSELGVNICLGTDSLASTFSLSLFDEMRILWKREPWLHPHDILKMATLNGAQALSLPAGKIAPGMLADLIAVPCAANGRDIHEAVLAFDQPIEWMMLDGKNLD